jgi:sensor c-di-GMP phosphodiesterase-like protein
MKIDRSFVSPASTAGTPRVISRAIVELAKALGLEVVVEGIESTAQARWFRSLGCQYAQGFHYSEPLRPAEASDYLAAHRVTAAPAGITKLEDRRRRGGVAAG